MSDFAKKRIDFVNNWPNSSIFPAEANYHERCDRFFEEQHKYPFMPMPLWYSNDVNYNILVSHLIDSLEMMPYHPNHAFAFLFIGFDYFCKTYYSLTKTTICLKNVADELSDLAYNNQDVQAILDELFSNMPMQSLLFLYKNLYEGGCKGQVYDRIIKLANNKINQSTKDIIDSIYLKYGYDPINYANSIRKGSALFRVIFSSQAIQLHSKSFQITNKFKLNVCLSGILYTIRNSYMHGSSASSTKSSKTSTKRYALNYYCFLSLYCFTMLLLICYEYNQDLSKQTAKLFELRSIMHSNIDSMNLLFGNHMK